jgi:hypothetical protein
MKNKKLLMLLVLVFIAIVVFSIFAILPMERVVIKNKQPTQFFPIEKPPGLLESYDILLALSYGNLFNPTAEELFFCQHLKFNSSEFAFQFFNAAIEFFKNITKEFKIEKIDNLEIANFLKDPKQQEFFVLAWKENSNKVFSVTGKEKNIYKVVEWISKNL